MFPKLKMAKSDANGAATLVATLLCISLAFPCLAEDILVVRPDEVNFKNALDGMMEELDYEFDIFDFTIDRETTVEEFTVQYQQHKPRLIVLMEGKSIALYKRWQQKQSAGTPFPPALVCMTIFAEERIKELQNASGIKYEIQAVHSISSLRSALQQPVKRVGVLYSSNLRIFFANQKEICEKEEIELVGVMIDEKKGKLDKVINHELKKMVKDPTIDAIWVFNDNVILKDVYLEWAWVPRLKKYKKPVVVSLERLVSPLTLGHFAVVPDHFEMGVQAGRWIFEIQENEWNLEEIHLIKKPYSAHKKLNTAHIPKTIKLNETVIREEWFDFARKRN